MMSSMGFVRGGLRTEADSRGGAKDWERRPCGMVVQVRDASSDTVQAGPLIKVKVSYGPSTHEIAIAAYSTFGDLKKALIQGTGLQPQQQRLLYKGKEKDNCVYLHDAGVKNKSKIVLVEDPFSQEKRLLESRRDDAIAKACRAVADIHEEVDKLAEKVFAVEAAVKSGRQLRDSAIAEPTELLMCQLLKLDGIKAEGDAKSQRRILVRRVQKYVETLDALKVQNEMPKPYSRTVVTTKWETFDAGFGGATALTSIPTSHQHNGGQMLPQPAATSATLTDWERFD
eukprot:c26339_g1_i1 orf=570-1424(-)